MALLFFSACAHQVAPPGPGATSPKLSDTAFVTRDGTVLPVKRWLPDGDPLGIVLAVHGFNDYSKSFGMVPNAPGVGPTLSAKGFAVYAYDQRGFGRAPHVGLWAGGDVLAEDFADFGHVLKRAYRDIPLYAIGESMGGAVVIAGMTADDPPPIEAVVLVAPAVWARDTMPLVYRVALWLGAHTVPWAKPSGRGLGRQASDNIEMLRDAGADPLFIKDTRIDSIYGLSNLMDYALENVAEIPVPALFVYGAKDQIIPKNATLRAMRAFSAANDQNRTAFYKDSWHMMLRDRQADIVLGDVAAFLEEPSSELPSGAGRDAVDRLEAAQD